MKTKYILAAFRNACTPAARLAAWQNKHLRNRRQSLTDYYEKDASLAERRTARISSSGPELSAPEPENPLLWTHADMAEVLEAFPGKTFLSHRGWYSDNFENETLETYAVRLTRFPRLMFYAVLDSCNGDFRIALDEWEEIDFSECESEYDAMEAIRDAAKSVIRANDSTTENEAEESREFYRKEEVKFDIAENKETLKTLRSEIRELAHELKALCPSSLTLEYPAAGKALRDGLKALLRDRRELMATNAELSASL